jgi:hypothetical protein
VITHTRKEILFLLENTEGAIKNGQHGRYAAIIQWYQIQGQIQIQNIIGINPTEL